MLWQDTPRRPTRNAKRLIRDDSIWTRRGVRGGATIVAAIGIVTYDAYKTVGFDVNGVLK
jgi:hypothetical protein